MIKTILLLLGIMLASSQQTLTVDPGPAKTIALPAHDVTLFGHYVDSAVNPPMTFSWTQTSGPAAAVFSAPTTPTTSVSITTPGSYSFTFSVNDGAQTVKSTATVTLLASQTAFYVDPLFTGKGDGSAASPWPTIVDSPGSPQWAAINAALAKDNVIVYFPARIATSDVPSGTKTPIDIWRTDKGSNRLTLDGMSEYTTSDLKPQWVPYTGTNKFQVAVTTGSWISIGVQSSNTTYPMNYTTIRGFDVSGSSGRLTVAGNYTTVEYTHVHNITTTGANIQFQPAVTNYPACAVAFGNLHDITFRGNAVDHGFGEGIYVSGTYDTAAQGGCTAWGNTHRDILIESNFIDQSASNGGQPDGVDMKAGLTNVTVRNNEIIGGGSGARGIVTLGVFPAADGTPTTRTDYLFEGNRIHDRVGSSYAIDLANSHFTIVRNNVVANSPGMDVSQGSGQSWPYTYSDYVVFSNNTFNVASTAISVFDCHCQLRYNLVTGFNGVQQFIKTSAAPAANVDSDYNVLIQQTVHNPFGGGWVEGSHTIFLSNPAVTSLPW